MYDATSCLWYRHTVATGTIAVKAVHVGHRPDVHVPSARVDHPSEGERGKVSAETALSEETHRYCRPHLPPTPHPTPPQDT